MTKFAVLGMDVEDWYHLDYFLDSDCDTTQSTLDGLSVFLKILKDNKIKTTFFVVGEIVEKYSNLLLKLLDEGHEIALHSYHHKRPLLMSIDEFTADTIRSIELINDKMRYQAKGFRAPCFSLDRKRLEILKELGLRYDTSKINFKSHKLYSSLDLTDFVKKSKDIYILKDFFEFEITTVKIFGKSIPISGGGYLRIFPWWLTKLLLKRLFKTEKNYFFYIHPFEFSKNYDVKLPIGTSLITRIRFNSGRRTVEKKMNRLIKLLVDNDFKIVKFEDLLDLK